MQRNKILSKVLLSALVFSVFLPFSINAQSSGPSNNVSPTKVSQVPFKLAKKINLSSCGDLSVSGGIYSVTNDINTSGDCLNIMADNVKIVGNGYTLSNNSSNPDDDGINSENNRNLKIENLKIDGYGVGIKISGTEGVIIDNVVITRSASTTLFVFDSDNLEIKNSEFRENLGPENAFFSASNDPINAKIINNKFLRNNGNAIRGIGLIADIENNIISDNGEATQNPRNRGIWIRSIIERPAPGRVIVPASANIKNNSLIRIGGSGIVCSAYDGNYCDIDGNFIKDVYGPAAISFGPVGSIARNNLIMSIDNVGIDVIKRQVRDVSVENNVVVDSKIGISTEPGLYQDQFVENITLDGNIIIGSENGIYIIGVRHDSTGHYIANNIVNNSTKDAFYIRGNRLSDVVFENNQVSGTLDGFLDLNVSTSGVNDLDLINNVFGKYYFGGSDDVSFVSSEFGKIEFQDNVSGAGNSLSNEVSISFNSAIIDDKDNPGLNIPSMVTFNKMPGNFNDPVIVKDGEVCSDCSTYGSLNNDTVVFDVPGAGSYSVRER